MKPPKTIAVLNGSLEISKILEEFLREEGFNTVNGIITDFKTGKESFVSFMKTHQPDLILYDVPPPYDHNLTFLELLKATDLIKDECIIVTTTNKAALEKLAGKHQVLEILGKPYDLKIVVETINQKLKKC
jgi:DNA-binding NtrC family response regulator